MREVDISPNQRYALLGKTRSGKTSFGMALAAFLVPYDKKKAMGWEAWWIDTKGDEDDLQALANWGFKEQAPGLAGWRKSNGTRKLFKMRNDPKKNSKNPRNRMLAWQKSQEIFAQAFEHQGVVVIVDEYVQVVQSERNAGEDLLNIFQRGGGLDVGLIGMTQEPVFVPRQLISQASHQFIFNVTYPKDVQFIQGIFSGYKPPLEYGDSHGFYHVAVDYDGQAVYSQNQYQWAKEMGLLNDRQVKTEDVERVA